MKILPPPGRARTQQLLLLGVLLIGVAYMATHVFGPDLAVPVLPASNSPRPGPATTAQAPSPIAKAATGTNAMPQPLALDKLEPVPEEPGTNRNPFRFGTKPPPPAPPAPAYVPPPAPVAPPVPAGPPPPRVDPITLKFIGRIVLPDKKVVVTLSDGKGNIMSATEGQVVDGRYRIVRIGEESLVIEYLNGTGRATLALRGS